MIKLIYNNSFYKSLDTHSFPKNVNDLEELKENFDCLFCNNGCGLYAAVYNKIYTKNIITIHLGIHTKTISGLSTYNYDLKKYYTCNELMIKSVLF